MKKYNEFLNEDVDNMKIRIDYDDVPIGVVDKINSVLKYHGLRVEYDEEEMEEYDCVDCKIIKII